MTKATAGKRKKCSRKNAERVVYDCICEHPGLCTYELSKRLGMSGGNLRSALSRLHGKGLVRFKFMRGNPRTRKLTYPVGFWELMPKNLKRLFAKKKRKK